jgi:hypothetical protein
LLSLVLALRRLVGAAPVVLTSPPGKSSTNCRPHVTGLVAAVIFAGLAVLVLLMRQPPEAVPPELADEEAVQSVSTGAVRL